MRPAAPSCAADASCAGQAYLETLIVLLVLLLCLFGFLQAAISLGGRDVLHHAAETADPHAAAAAPAGAKTKGADGK